MAEPEPHILLHGHRVGREALRRFKRAYEDAKAMGLGEFVFDGQIVLVTYARYVVEYAQYAFGGAL